MMAKILFSSLLIIFMVTGCTQTITKPTAKPNLPIKDNDLYAGSNYKGNYIWGGAMNLAWNDLRENVVHAKVELNTNDTAALQTTFKLNESVFSKKDLDEPSYYVKSGFGQKTVELINKESRLKFPDKSFPDLQMNLAENEIIAYAYLLKKVEYKVEFTEKDVLFNKKVVAGFYADNKWQKYNVDILQYSDDDKFIIALRLKDEADELILAKGYEQNRVCDIAATIAQLPRSDRQIMLDNDVFEMPKLHLDYSRDYSEMNEKHLANRGFEDYEIRQMSERVKFDMDQKGARVENEAELKFQLWDPNKPKSKILILDKPFWVVMKRANSPNPYFILGVNNAQLMASR